MYAYIGTVEIEMTLKQAQSISHPGQCDMDVAELMKNPKIKRQLNKISDEDLIDALVETGGWTRHELLYHSTREELQSRLLWIAGCEISEEHNSK